MLTPSRLAEKRRKKEVKRQIKRRKIFLATIKALKGRKQRALTERAMKIINQNPVLLKQFNDNHEKVKTDNI